MVKEAINRLQAVTGKIAEIEELRDPPKTISRAAATKSGGHGELHRKRADPPKTIPGTLATISWAPDLPIASSDPVETLLQEFAAAKEKPVRPKKKRGRGAPPGNLNALKTGRHIGGNRALRKQTWVFLSGVDALVRTVAAVHGFEPPRRERSRKQFWPVLPESHRKKYRDKVRP